MLLGPAARRGPEHRHAVGRRDPPRRAQQFAVDTAALGVVVDRNVAQDLADGVGPSTWSARKVSSQRFSCTSTAASARPGTRRRHRA